VRLVYKGTVCGGVWPAIQAVRQPSHSTNVVPKSRPVLNYIAMRLFSSYFLLFSALVVDTTGFLNTAPVLIGRGGSDSCQLRCRGIHANRGRAFSDTSLSARKRRTPSPARLYMQEKDEDETPPNIEYYVEGGDIGQVQEARTRLGRVEEVSASVLSNCCSLALGPGTTRL
jgi:hypothetical protein